MNNNLFRLSSALAIVLALGVVLNSCPANTDDDTAGTPGTTSDQTVFIGSFADVEFIGDFRARFSNQANEVTSAAKIVVLDGTYATNGSAIQAITGAYNAGAAIVLVRPSASQQAALMAVIQHKSVLHQAGNNTPIDMYAFNKFDEHHVLMTQLIPDSREDDTVTRLTRDENDPENITETTEAFTGSHQVGAPVVNWASFLDAIVQWLDTHNNGSRSTAALQNRAATGDVAAIVNSQRLTITAPGACEYTLENTTIGCNTIAVSIQYYVWAIYNKDTQKDYYIVSEDITIPSAGLGYRENYDSGDHYRNTGFYLNNFATNHIPQSPNGTALARDSQVFLLKQSPETTNGSQTVTTGTSWSMSGSLGFNGLGGTGSGSGSVSYSTSTSRTITDFGVRNNSLTTPGTANALWEYHLQNAPEVSAPPLLHSRTPKVGPAPNLARSTATFSNEWIWEIPTETDSTDSYRMQVQGISWYAYTWAHSNRAWSCVYGAAESGANFKQTFILTPPPRN